MIAEASNGGEAVHPGARVETRPRDSRHQDAGNGWHRSRQADRAERPIPIILLTAYSEKELAERAAEANVAAYLMKPVSEQDLLPAIALAVSRFKQSQALHQEVDDLRDALETRKLVERAKGILMRRLNLTEEEAFRRMQRRSQNENKKLGEIAEAIITADGML